MSFILNYFGIKIKSFNNEGNAITDGNTNAAPLRAHSKKNINSVASTETQKIGGVNAFCKLPPEIIEKILFDSNDWNIVQLSKWRMISHQWKQCIDDNAFSAYNLFISACINPSITSENLPGHFIKENSLNFTTKQPEVQLVGNNNDRNKNLLTRQVEIFWLFKENISNSSNESNNDRLSRVKSIKLILGTNKEAIKAGDLYLEKMIIGIFFKSNALLKTRNIPVTLEGLSLVETDKMVVKENTKRLEQAIPRTLTNCNETRNANIWFDHETGLVEAVHGHDSSPACFDGVVEETLKNRRFDGVIHFSSHSIQMPRGTKTFRIWDFPQPVNSNDWSPMAASAFTAFLDEQVRLKKQLTELEAKYGSSNRSVTSSGFTPEQIYLYLKNLVETSPPKSLSPSSYEAYEMLRKRFENS